MKRITFSNYVRQLPSNIVLEYLNVASSSKILTSGVYDSITSKVFDGNYIDLTLQSVSSDLRAEIFKIYICGDSGKKVSSSRQKAQILKTFLAFEGLDGNSDTLFGFPDLSPLIAKRFAQNLSVCKEQSRPLYFSSTFLSDFVVILDMFHTSESKICNNKNYSQRWTELLKERCGIGKLFTAHEKLQVVLDFILAFSRFCGAKFEDADSKLSLLSKAQDLLQRVAEEIDGDFPKIIAKFSKCIDFEFLRSLADEDGERVKLDMKGLDEIAETVDFSLKFFHWCGLIELSSGGDFVIRKNASLPFENGHILPDFSVYIPIGVNPLQLNKILYSTKICSVDVIYRGKIDRKRVEEALVSGVTENEIISILQEWKVPMWLQKTIEEWIYSFNRAFLDLPYIAVKNDVAASIASHAQLKEKILPMEGYTFLKIKSGEENSVFQVLEKIGFDLRKIKEKNEVPLEDEESDEDDAPCKFNKKPVLDLKKQEYILIN